MSIAKFDFLKKINKNFLILYVEDNEKVQQQTIKMLNKLFPNIIACDNAMDGLEKFKKNIDEINLVITDIEMPEKNGLSMIKDIKSINENIPIIIFSAYDDTQYFLEAIELGINGYVLKPYDLQQILSVLDKVISKDLDSKNLIQISDTYSWEKNDKQLLKNNQTIKLTKNEIKLIEFLLLNSKSTKPLDDIENYIFDDLEHNERRVRNIISRLNSKLEENIVKSIYSQGYKIS